MPGLFCRLLDTAEKDLLAIADIEVVGIILKELPEIFSAHGKKRHVAGTYEYHFTDIPRYSNAEIPYFVVKAYTVKDNQRYANIIRVFHVDTNNIEEKILQTQADIKSGKAVWLLPDTKKITLKCLGIGANGNV